MLSTPIRSTGTNVIEKAKSYFEGSLRANMANGIFLGFPTHIRDYFESQTGKIKVGVKNHMLDFERSMHCFAEVRSVIGAYKVSEC